MDTGQASSPVPGGRVPAAALQAQRRLRTAARLEHLVHDLRNPLSVIQGYGQLLRAASVDDGDRRDLEALLREVERMARRLDDLESFVAAEPAEAERVDLERLVRMALRPRAGLAPPTVKLPSPAPVALGHLGSYAQALMACFERLATPREPWVLGLVGAPAGRLVLVLAEGRLPGSGRMEWSDGAPATEELRLCVERLAGYGARLVATDRAIVLDLPAA